MVSLLIGNHNRGITMNLDKLKKTIYGTPSYVEYAYVRNMHETKDQIIYSRNQKLHHLKCAIIKTFGECQADSCPPSIETLKLVNKLIDNLPDNVEVPDHGIEPDGYLTLEWYKTPTLSLSVSIKTDHRAGIIAYSAVYNGLYVNGSHITSGQWPAEMWDAYRKVMVS